MAALSHLRVSVHSFAIGINLMTDRERERDVVMVILPVAISHDVGGEFWHHIYCNVYQCIFYTNACFPNSQLTVDF